MDCERDEFVRGIGEVCISASSLEWSLAYLAAIVRYRGSDDKFRVIARTPGEPLKEFRKVVRSPGVLQALEQAEAEKILVAAERLLDKRNRVVHSAIMDELEPGTRFYDAWHAKSNSIWSVDPVHLNSLARDLMQCAAAADAFGTAWEERAEGTVVI
jgi:hypothetical protein